MQETISKAKQAVYRARGHLEIVLRGVTAQSPRAPHTIEAHRAAEALELALQEIHEALDTLRAGDTGEEEAGAVSGVRSESVRPAPQDTTRPSTGLGRWRGHGQP